MNGIAWFDEMMGHFFMKGVTQIENNDSRSGSGYKGSKIRIRSDIFVKK